LPRGRGRRIIPRHVLEPRLHTRISVGACPPFILGAALVSIGAVLIGLAWVNNEYGAVAFCVGHISVFLVAVWGERNKPVIPVYEATIEDVPR
jgi:hypothetical protein